MLGMAETPPRIADAFDANGSLECTIVVGMLKREQELMEAWAKNVDPPDAIRWDLRPEMDYLD